LPWVSLVGGDHMIVARKCAIRRPKIAHFRAWIFPPRRGAVAVGDRSGGCPTARWSTVWPRT